MGNLGPGSPCRLRRNSRTCWIPRDVAQGLGDKITFVLTRLLQPAVMRFPFFFGGILRQRRRPCLVPHEPVRKGMGLGAAIANARATYECIETHRLCSVL